MQIHFSYLLYSLFLIIPLAIYFYISIKKKQKSPDDIQKMIKELENKIINVST
tara:strand:- start:684 stop:842 length:159 start_codon:yes stop_codon:yes gene_type:complete